MCLKSKKGRAGETEGVESKLNHMNVMLKREEQEKQRE